MFLAERQQLVLKESAFEYRREAMFLRFLHVKPIRNQMQRTKFVIFISNTPLRKMSKDTFVQFIQPIFCVEYF